MGITQNLDFNFIPGKKNIVLICIQFFLNAYGSFCLMRKLHIKINIIFINSMAICHYYCMFKFGMGRGGKLNINY